ncbi:class I SAM-dependent methyltransferase [Flavihumibacter sp. UBA7668]|uniref:class I SAM-dependent methyltransferase n=1 Tax=Flavihumibacter sp. UBA7668 TaxID=1946542 RepID=UPI0025C22A7D|nr:class I SAM-dependent methyltransferase [Flavihumibacter sp. UBA7668]
MSTGDWFENWFNSPYYHLLYHRRNEAEADDFVRRLIQYLHPPSGSRMLDIACGKGRHAQVIAALGYEVTGIDLAPASIEEAQKYAHDQLHFYLHDMRLPFWVNYFDYAFNFFTSFGYFKTERENYNVIRTIAQSLKQGGIFIIDYLNVHFTEDNLIHTHQEVVNGIEFYITKWFDETHFYKKIEIMDSTFPEPLIYTEKVTKFSLGDMTDMLAFHDLQIQEVYGDYNFGHYHVKNSPRMIIMAKKFFPPT